ncbi:DUF2442 domain-containing protein [Aquisphaera insulae]|uniref:DUF2442 domain-containing protein n=1 Tax=Aquisphaera insulae TaxID=2712864 RepID=UPI0013EDD2E7|nr:DUF2442 domain-containing protein [Aquisphaera insulae]
MTTRDDGRKILDARLADEALVVRGSSSRVLRVPIRALDCLNGQPPAILHNFEIDPDGSFVYWPDLDVHLGWDQFLQVVDPSALRKAQQKTDEFNRRYGAAIREVRVQAGILQSKIPGLTERQLRRIERGECRATSSALAALARVHGLGTSDYLGRLAQALPSIVLTKPTAG